jgi:NAD(P)-dependent dehydrogenase (short-subunit alcohol dehydrogenase family)
MAPTGNVVVITGASSGIGRLAALELARRGNRVVAGARNVRGLGTLVDEVRDAPGDIVPVPTDVADKTQVDRLAQTAVDRYGRIDVWINNAGVMIYARVDETDLDELRRLLDVNVVGVHNGIRAALPVMGAQGSGIIVNIGSVESVRAFPLQGAYAATKHAVKALTESLRVELEHDGSPIRVVLIEPSYINTPLFDHARSKIGTRPQPVPPMYEPDVVVSTLLHVLEHPLDEVVVGGAGKGMTILERINPKLLDAGLKAGGLAFRAQLSDEPPRTRDNLFAPIDEPGASHGRWHSLARSSSFYTQLIGLHETARRLAVLGVAAIAGLVFLRRL